MTKTERRPWRTTDVKYIRENYHKLTAGEIAAHLGRSTASVTHFIYKMDIRKSLKRKEGDIWPVVDVTNRSAYLMTKHKGEYIRYSRVLWEKHNGKIPNGHVISFKDGNCLNCEIENLICISNSQLLRRNAKKAIKACKASAKRKRRAKLQKAMSLPS